VSVQSIHNSDAFWGAQARALLQWDAPFNRVQGGSFSKGDINWFAEGKLNVSVNCIDRHLETRGEQVGAARSLASPFFFFHGLGYPYIRRCAVYNLQ
jgi:hypothetical protein